MEYTLKSYGSWSLKSNPRHGKLRPVISMAALMACAMALIGVMPAAGQEVITLRSGAKPLAPYAQDSSITLTQGVAFLPLSGIPFTPADFANASAGPNPYVVGHFYRTLARGRMLPRGCR